MWIPGHCGNHAFADRPQLLPPRPGLRLGLFRQCTLKMITAPETSLAAPCGHLMKQVILSQSPSWNPNAVSTWLRDVTTIKSMFQRKKIHHRSMAQGTERLHRKAAVQNPQ